MQVSRQEFVRNKAQEQRTKDLSEIQDAINKLNRSGRQSTNKSLSTRVN